MAFRSLGVQNSIRDLWSVVCWATQGVMVTTRSRTSNLFACPCRVILSLRKVILTVLHRMWGRKTYLSLMPHWIRHPTKKRLSAKLINKTLRQSPKVTPNQMINVQIIVMISPRNLFNKRDQSNQKYVALPELLSHLPDPYILESTNNARKWDVTKVKSGQPMLESLYLRYLMLKTTISHASQRLKLPITFCNPTNMPCQLTRIDG